MPELMILTAISQFDAKTGTMNMIHGDNCTKQEWIDSFNLPGSCHFSCYGFLIYFSILKVILCDEVWHIMHKMSQQHYGERVLAMMSVLVLFGSDRGYGAALDGEISNITFIYTQILVRLIG